MSDTSRSPSFLRLRWRIRFLVGWFTNHGWRDPYWREATIMRACHHPEVLAIDDPAHPATWCVGCGRVWWRDA